MCNFYMMYYTNSKGSQTDLECWGNNSPHLLKYFPFDTNNLAPYPGFAGNGMLLLSLSKLIVNKQACYWTVRYCCIFSVKKITLTSLNLVKNRLYTLFVHVHLGSD